MKNIKVIDIKSSEYPARLREIPGPPEQLYCAGDISLLKTKSVGVVGSRKNTVYGKNVAMMIGRCIAESGLAVTSGLAMGIDAYSHEGALDAGGKVIGVLGSGIDRMGPARNLALMKRGLEGGGLVVSEYPPDMPAGKHTFPERNRIISGLSEAVVVVEADLDSGSLITAKHAAEQGRPVYAVPGNINSHTSMGTNLLIRDGAVPLVIIDDLIRDIGAEPAIRNGTALDLDSDEAKVFEAVRLLSGGTVDEIVRLSGLSSQLVSSVITIMEIKGLIESYAGRVYISR